MFFKRQNTNKDVKTVYIETTKPYENGMLLRAENDEDAIQTRREAEDRGFLMHPELMETYEIPKKDVKIPHTPDMMTMVTIKTMDNARKVV